MTRAKESSRPTRPLRARSGRSIPGLFGALAWTCVSIATLAALGACSEGARLDLVTAAMGGSSLEAAGDEAPDEPPLPPPPLEPRVGATISGTLQPGETVVHTVHLEADEYVEVYFDHISSEARFRLYTPADLADQPSVAIGWGEYHADPKGQSLWGLSRGEGEYQLEVRAKPDIEACPYSLEILSFHTIGEKELAKQEGEEAWEAGEKAISKGRYEEAVDSLRVALDRWTAADYVRGVAAAHERIGRSFRELGQLDKAAQHLREAVDYWNTAKDPGGVSFRLSELAEVEGDRGNWELAFETVERAADVARQAGLLRHEGEALKSLCSLHLTRGETQAALETCRRTVNYFFESGLRSDAPEALNLLGLIHRRVGDLDQAHRCYIQALEILDEYPDPSSSATIHRNLGALYDSTGDFQEALIEYQQALEAYENLGQRNQIADTLYAIGTLYERTGKLDDTLLYYERALEMQERTGPASNLALTLFGIGWVHLQRKELDEATNYLERALEIGRATRSKYLIAWTLEGIADLRLVEGRPKEAVRIIEEALKLQQDVRNRWDHSRLLYQLSRAQLQLGRPDQALEALRDAAKINEEIGNRRGLAGNFYRMAQIYRSLGELEAARHAIEQSLAIADVLRERVTEREMRTLVGATHQDYHELFIDILMDQHHQNPSSGHAAEALRAAERARAQSLLEVLAEADLELGRNVNRDLVSQRERIRRQLVEVEARRARLLDGAEEEVEPSELFGVKLDLDKLLADLGETERRIREASPSYAALTRPEPATVGEVQRSLLDPSTVLLEFRLGRDRSFLFAVTPDDLFTFILPARADLEEDARCIHWLISEFGSSKTRDPLDPDECLGNHQEQANDHPAATPFEAQARHRELVERALTNRMEALSERIFGKADRAGVLDYARLVLVADGALEYVPFAALPDPSDGRLLLLDHEIARLPSASFLDYHRRHRSESHTTDGTLAIIADPIYEPEDQRIAGTRRSLEERPEERTSYGRFQRLAFASEEAQAIAAFASPDQTLLALGTEASRERVSGASLSDYRYIHFATHGEIDTHYPQLSGLVLSLVNEHGEPTEDGFLRLHDIYEMQLNADMVVLSACETALGREIRGEGLVGLARGFMYAGAERVVASLWQVQDRATAELMEHFYRGLLQEGRHPADALRHAQLEMISEAGGRYSFPYYWAGFVLQGEWR